MLSDVSRGTPPLEEQSFYEQQEPETALTKARRHRQRSTNVRIRTGGKLHKFRDTQQERMKRQLAEQFQRHADATRGSSQPQTQLDQTRMNQYFGDRRGPPNQGRGILDESRPASIFTFQHNRQPSDQDIGSDGQVGTRNEAPWKQSPSKPKRTKKEKEVYKGIIAEDAQHRDARVKFT